MPALSYGVSFAMCEYSHLFRDFSFVKIDLNLLCLTCEHRREETACLARNTQILAPVRHLQGHQAEEGSHALIHEESTSTRPEKG